MFLEFPNWEFPFLMAFCQATLQPVFAIVVPSCFRLPQKRHDHLRRLLGGPRFTFGIQSFFFGLVGNFVTIAFIEIAVPMKGELFLGDKSVAVRVYRREVPLGFVFQHAECADHHSGELFEINCAVICRKSSAV